MSIGILAVGALIFMAHFFVVVFKKTRIPDVLLLMACGVVLGPVLHLVGPTDFGLVGPAVSNIALIVILFEGGLSLKIRTVVGALGQTAVVAGLTWLLSALVAALLMYWLTPVSVGWGLALMTGAIVGATSPAVVVPMVRMLGMDERPRTVVFLESAFTDVLCIVVAIGIAQAMKAGSVSATGMFGRIALSFFAAVAIGTAGALGWSMLLGRVRQFPNTIFASVAWVFILYGVCEVFHLSGPIAALAAGVTLANVGGRKLAFPLLRSTFVMEDLTEVDHLFLGELVFLLKTFFFVYLGISISFRSVPQLWIAAGIVVAIYLARLFVIRIFASRKYTCRDASLMTILVPKGLAAAVLATLPAQYGFLGAEWVSGVIFPVIIFSIVLTSLLAVTMERVPLNLAYRRLFRTFRPSAAGTALIPVTGEAPGEAFGPDGLPSSTFTDDDASRADDVRPLRGDE